MDENTPPVKADKAGILRTLFDVNVKQEPIFYEAAEKAMDRLSNTQPNDVRGTAASQIELLSRFYDLSLSQAQRSFRWALIAGIVGFAFMLGAIVSIWTNNQDFSMVTLASGVVIEFIATINFYLYNKTLTQLTLFQGRLEITQRFLLANSLCESLGDELRDTTRAELIRKLSSTHSAEPIEPPRPHNRRSPSNTHEG
jgi:hypothetical protein